MYRRRRVSVLGIIIAIMAFGIIYFVDDAPPSVEVGTGTNDVETQSVMVQDALKMLDGLPVKGRAPKTGYARTQFGNGWLSEDGCDTRNTILNRDLIEVVMGDDCKVMSGVLNDPYTGTRINFTRGTNTSAEVQIDHVVALSNAWQTGAQLLSEEDRVALANDPLNLLAVSGRENQIKSDSDAATWLPKYKPFRCQYVERQIKVKNRYNLWVTSAEGNAMKRVLESCKK